MKESNIITDDIVIKALEDFKVKYSNCGSIRYTENGYSLTLPEIIDEIKNNSDIGKKLKQQIVCMSLMNLLQIFR